MQKLFILFVILWIHVFGVIAYQVGKIELGIKFIELAIQSNPHVALFYSNIGEMHRKLNSIQLSIQYGKRAATLDRKSATIWSNLGIAYYDAKQYIKAEVCHQIILMQKWGDSLTIVVYLGKNLVLLFINRNVKYVPQALHKYANLFTLHLLTVGVDMRVNFYLLLKL